MQTCFTKRQTDCELQLELLLPEAGPTEACVGCMYQTGISQLEVFLWTRIGFLISRTEAKRDSVYLTICERKMFFTVIRGSRGVELSMFVLCPDFSPEDGCIIFFRNLATCSPSFILGTSHIIRKVLQAETLSLNGGVHHWLKGRSTREERKPVTRDNNNNNNNNNILLSCSTTIV
jgi:hypothetical protein